MKEGNLEDQVFFMVLLLFGVSLVLGRKVLAEDLYTKDWASVSQEDVFWTI